MWRVLIVEDDPEMRSFFESCVARSPALALAACVGTVAHARDFLARPGPAVDVLLTDLGLPDGSGLELIHLVRQTHPACETLVISMFGDEDNVLSSIEAGALGYIHKDAAPDDIAQTILDMKAGGSPISPMIARRVLARFQQRHSESIPVAATDAGPFANGATLAEKSPLSTREQDVLELIARGFSYGEIARLQSVSVHTVQTHIKHLYSKLAVHSRSEAVYEATRMGWLPRF
jgi:DNA-binding NarL/FixJ family response regulator